MSYLRLGDKRQRQKQRKAPAAKPKKSASGNLNKSLRRHANLNHGSAGGIGHMGRRSKPRTKADERPPAPEAKPEPMTVALIEYVTEGT